MIKENELRKYNKVLWEGIEIYVLNILETGINGDPASNYQNNVIPFSQLQPINLTSDRLDKVKVMYKHFADEFFIRIVSGGVSIGQRMNGIKYLKHIKYVHQLQNLYYSLTGEELEAEGSY